MADGVALTNHLSYSVGHSHSPSGLHVMECNHKTLPIGFKLVALASGVLLAAGLLAVAVVSAAPSVLELDTERDITSNGINPGDDAGYDMAVGDLNDDAIPDLVISAVGADPGGKGDAGQTYVLFGPITPGTKELSSISPDIVINGSLATDIEVAGNASQYFFGSDIAVGDFNGDGINDLIAAANAGDPDAGRTDAGQVNVIFGPLTSGTSDIVEFLADIRYEGISALDSAGFGLAIGDVNNDGASDLVVGAPFADPGGRDSAGEVYVILGVPPAAAIPGLTQ